MGTVLKFVTEDVPQQAAPATPRRGRAEIIIFPGVRRERHRDHPDFAADSGKARDEWPEQKC